LKFFRDEVAEVSIRLDGKTCPGLDIMLAVHISREHCGLIRRGAFQRDGDSLGGN
jgi:hypothetical protein